VARNGISLSFRYVWGCFDCSLDLHYRSTQQAGALSNSFETHPKELLRVCAG
jgi:hypothetical protein